MGPTLRLRGHAVLNSDQPIEPDRLFLAHTARARPAALGEAQATTRPVRCACEVQTIVLHRGLAGTGMEGQAL